MEADYKALKNGGFMRQRQKNKFSMRLKVVGGDLSAAQIRVIAEAAERFGAGRVHLTSRQGVEIPFVDLRDTEAVKAFLAKGGVSAGVCGPRVRTVTACQGDAVCPSACIDTASLAREISERYFGRELPHKFKLGVTGCVNNCLKAEENDLGVKGALFLELDGEACTGCGLCVKICRDGALSLAGEEGPVRLDPARCNNCGRCVSSCPSDAWKGTPGYRLYFGGTFGNVIGIGEALLPLLRDKEELFAAADRAVEFFVERGRPGERFRSVILRAGWQALADSLAGALAGRAGGGQ
ncbi:MAG: 4Fe-4S binding protein [Deltaproteobacteria bacterium]|jgi:dissimilatory sulfite reductase (desulfoviridin) alpha/beta subunit|nr:4Fe-4S binding protein [Deltaproteobacteria bacterium]